MTQKPFHESIVDVINRLVSSNTNAPIATIGRLLRQTSIPKGHDAIIAAWEAKCKELRYSDRHVVPKLLQEKEALVASAGSAPPAHQVPQRTAAAFERHPRSETSAAQWERGRYGGSAH